MPKIDLGFETDNLKQLSIATGSMSVLAFVVFLLNRAKKLPALRVAAAVFILAVTVFIFLSDTPEEVISGRTSFVLLVPIFLASVLVYPASGVIVAFLEMLAFLLIAPEHLSINNFSLALIYFFAIICWVSAHSAESAIATALREGTKSKTIFASTADGLVVFDVNGKVMQVNGAGLKMLSGKEPTELLQATNRTESQDGVWKIELENGRTLAVTKAPMLEENRNVGTSTRFAGFHARSCGGTHAKGHYWRSLPRIADARGGHQGNCGSVAIAKKNRRRRDSGCNENDWPQYPAPIVVD